MFTELILTTQMQVIRVYCLLLIVFVFHIRVIPYKITGFLKNWEMYILDFLHFWICWYMPLKNFTCKFIGIYLKRFQRYGSPNLGAFLEAKLIDMICLIKVFKTISCSETYIKLTNFLSSIIGEQRQSCHLIKNLEERRRE